MCAIPTENIKKMKEKEIHRLNRSYDVVVCGAGEAPTSTIALQILKQSKHVVACDGALQMLLDLGIVPDAVIGDGDSIPLSLRETYNTIFHQITEQDSNDLTKATLYALEHYVNKVSEPRFCYLGTTGKREDHTIANIALMLHYARTFHIQPIIVSDYGYFMLGSGKSVFASFARQQVSVFRISGERLESEGLRWHLFPFTEFWQGTLNEALGDSFTIDSDGKYLVYQTHEAKEINRNN